MNETPGTTSLPGRIAAILAADDGFDAVAEAELNVSGQQHAERAAAARMTPAALEQLHAARQEAYVRCTAAQDAAIAAAKAVRALPYPGHSYDTARAAADQLGILAANEHDRFQLLNELMIIAESRG